jgi:hypothetical protein
MKTYKVKIKGERKTQTIKAKTELEAKVLFSKKNNLSYRHFAGKLEVLGDKQTRPDGARQK